MPWGGNAAAHSSFERYDLFQFWQRPDKEYPIEPSLYR